MTELAGRTNFYVIVGSSAGALIGLQFVVMALVVDLPRTQEQARAAHAFVTPNIIHFGAVLLLSAVVCAPWHTMSPATLIFGVLGLCGVAKSIIVTRRLRIQTSYRPEFEDRLFHCLLPFVAYTTLALSSSAAQLRAYTPMFGLLLFVGIHNG
jgi:hypothetical protein